MTKPFVLMLSLIFLYGCASAPLIPRTSLQVEILANTDDIQYITNKKYLISALTKSREFRSDYIIMSKAVDESLRAFNSTNTKSANEAEVLFIFDYDTDWHPDGFEKVFYLRAFPIRQGVGFSSVAVTTIKISIIDEELDPYVSLNKYLPIALNGIKSNNVFSLRE